MFLFMHKEHFSLTICVFIDWLIVLVNLENQDVGML